MTSSLQLSANGRLIQKRTIETEEGLRDQESDVTDTAHRWINERLQLQPGVTLGSVFELLGANEVLRSLYARNWVEEYVARHKDLASGKIQPKSKTQKTQASTQSPEAEGADEPQEPELEAIVLTWHQEMHINAPTFARLKEAHAASVQAKESHGLVHLDQEDPGLTSLSKGNGYWHISGRSVAFAEDTELWGVQYTAGQTIDYSVSFNFDQCIHLPLEVGAGRLNVIIGGAKRKNRFTATLGVTSDELGKGGKPSTSITLNELIEAITYDFSFYGGPQSAQEFEREIKESVDELSDPDHSLDLMFGMAHMFAPDGGLGDVQSNQLQAKALADLEGYWSEQMITERRGLSHADIAKRARQGYLMELRSMASASAPKRVGYPAKQFGENFDADLMRFFNWIASQSCSDWATEAFLRNWRFEEPGGLALDGWDAMNLVQAPESMEVLSDPGLRAIGKRVAPMRPVYAAQTPKRALVEAFEAFAAQCKSDYEQRED